MDKPKAVLGRPLEALLKQRQWERDALALEAERARRIADERGDAHKAVLVVIAGAESKLRALYEAPAGFPLEHRQVLEVFLKHQYQVADERKQAAASALAVHAQVIQQLERSRVAVKVLEKYGERSLRAHDQVERRRELRAADDMWLLRRGRR